MSLIDKRSPIWGMNTKTSSILTFETGENIPKYGCVMLDPKDPTCSTVIEWDGVDEDCKLGTSTCPRSTPYGECIAIRIFESVPSLSKDANMDSEFECFCDSVGTIYLKHVTYDHSTDPVTITTMNTLSDGTPYEPIGKEEKAPAKRIKATYDVVGDETVLINPASAMGINPPADATGAKVSIILDDPNCTAHVRWDGKIPTTNTKNILCNKACVCIGCTAGSAGHISELSEFLAVTDGCTGRLEVTYYKEV